MHTRPRQANRTGSKAARSYRDFSRCGSSKQVVFNEFTETENRRQMDFLGMSLVFGRGRKFDVGVIQFGGQAIITRTAEQDTGDIPAVCGAQGAGEAGRVGTGTDQRQAVFRPAERPYLKPDKIAIRYAGIDMVVEQNGRQRGSRKLESARHAVVQAARQMAADADAAAQ